MRIVIVVSAGTLSRFGGHPELLHAVAHVVR